MLMHNTYAAMPNLMRAPAEVQFPLIVFGQIVMAFFFTLVFVRGFGSGGGAAGGFRYGILLALFLCGLDVIDYAVEPLTTTVLLAWCVGGIVELAIGCNRRRTLQTSRHECVTLKVAQRSRSSLNRGGNYFQRG